MLLLSFSIFSDCQSLKTEKENNSMKTPMQKFNHRILRYKTTGTQEQVLVRQVKRAMRVLAIEVLL